MQKRIFIIHGWDGNPGNCWFPWLKRELENRGFAVFVPLMPNPGIPEINSWVGHLDNTVGVPDENTYFVGHSIGCQTILRYVEQLSIKIGGIICVAGFLNLPYLKTEEEKEIAKPWLEKSIDFEKIKRNTAKIIAIFSDNDPDVSLDDRKIFEEKLGAKTLVEHNKGHFSDDVGVKELPSILKSVLEISQ